MKQRFAKPVKNFDEKKIIKVSDEWLDRLNHFEFKSKIRKYLSVDWSTVRPTVEYSAI